MNLSRHSLSLLFAFLLLALVTSNRYFFSADNNVAVAPVRTPTETPTGSVGKSVGVASSQNISASAPITLPSLDPAAGVSLSIDTAAIRSALLISVAGVSLPLPPAFSPPAGISASASLAYDLSTDHVLWVDNSSLVWPLASLTKIMTAVVAVENIGSDTLATITPAAVLTEEVAGDFRPGEVFAVSDLIRSLFLVSSNDAAATLAEYYGPERFLEQMTGKAAELGLSSTHFADPTGLSPENVSTVRDLSFLAGYLYRERPDLLSFSRLPVDSIADRRFGNIKEYKNINEFAGRPDFIGGKTGYTDVARGNLISIFNINNHPVLFIVLGTDDRFGETLKLLNWASSHPSLSTPPVL